MHLHILLCILKPNEVDTKSASSSPSTSSVIPSSLSTDAPGIETDADVPMSVCR